MPIPIYWLSSTASSTSTLVTSQYNTYLVGVTQGSTWYAIPGGFPLPANSLSTVLSTNLVGMAQVGGDVYIVDGSSTIYQFNLTSLAMVVYSTSAGSHPTNCNLACNWRGRLVLAGDANNPQNFYMSRVDAPTDWDYSQTDPTAAVAGNLSESGHIGEPITALMPYTDDYLLISCAHSLWMVEGDPADGGAIVRVSDQVGLVGPHAWTIDPQGTIYFVGSGGLYKVRPMFELYHPPENIAAGTFNQFFQALGWADQIVSLCYDTDLHYLYIYATPTNSTSTGTHLVYDARNGGLWPEQYPVSVGPTAAVEFPGQNSPNSRAIVMGGWDGYIRVMDQGAFDDDSSTISSHIVFGPYEPFPGQAVLSATTIDFGEIYTGDPSTIFNVSTLLSGGPNAYNVTQGTPRNSTLIPIVLDQRQKTMRQRLRGGWFTLTLQNSTDLCYYSFEGAVMEFEQAGRNRERR